MKRLLLIVPAFVLQFCLLSGQELISPVKLPKKSLNFMVSNDMGRRGVSQQKAIAVLMGKEADLNNIEFVAVAGDPIHDNGVKSVTDSEWKVKYEDIYTAPSLMDIPWHAVPGNHEYHGSIQALIDYSQISGRWEMPSRYYTVEKTIDKRGNKVLIVFIDTPPLIDRYRDEKADYSDAGKQDLEKELHWIDSTLSVSDHRWKIVIGHHPVYADTDKGESERTDMQSRVGKILEDRKTDLYICGHIHNFQHIRPEGKYVNYVVNSSASSSREVNKIDGTLFCNPDPGVTVCSATRDDFTFYFINNKGETVYSYALRK